MTVTTALTNDSHVTTGGAARLLGCTRYRILFSDCSATQIPELQQIVRPRAVPHPAGPRRPLPVTACAA
jgi:hypothetical protein